MIFLESEKSKLEQFRQDLSTLEEFTSRVDARSLSIPAKVATASEVAGLKHEFQVPIKEMLLRGCRFRPEPPVCCSFSKSTDPNF